MEPLSENLMSPFASGVGLTLRCDADGSAAEPGCGSAPFGSSTSSTSAKDSLGVSENRGTLFGGPYNKDPTISGTILGPPIFGNSHTLNPKPERPLIDPLKRNP